METKNTDGPTVEQLAQLLRETEQAHGMYEAQLGHSDADWPMWYAAYMLPKLQAMRARHDASATPPPPDAER